jgi:F-type H+-transporting ATPase subunit alpha
MIDVKRTEVKDYQMGLLEFFEEKHPEIPAEIVKSKKLEPELKESILRAADEFHDQYFAKPKQEKAYRGQDTIEH